MGAESDEQARRAHAEQSAREAEAERQRLQDLGRQDREATDRATRDAAKIATEPA